MTTKPLPEPAAGAKTGAAHAAAPGLWASQRAIDERWDAHASGWEATIELLSDPAAMARVRHAEAEVASGQVTTAEEMAALMAQRAARERSA